MKIDLLTFQSCAKFRDWRGGRIIVFSLESQDRYQVFVPFHESFFGKIYFTLNVRVPVLLVVPWRLYAYLPTRGRGIHDTFYRYLYRYFRSTCALCYEFNVLFQVFILSTFLKKMSEISSDNIIGLDSEFNFGCE